MSNDPENPRKRRGYTGTASRQLMGARESPVPEGESGIPTPFAILCKAHRQVFLTPDEYTRQLDRPDSLWTCPRCGAASRWDDDNYDKNMGAPKRR